MLLAIVPARGGSKGIHRKNMRLLNGRPLLDYTLAALLESRVADRLLVSSDDPAILAWCRLRGVETHERAPHLAGDRITVSTLAASIADELDWTGDIGIFQPTSPLRTARSVIDAVATFGTADCDSLASCVRETHLFWRELDDGRTVPLFTERVNRQFAHSSVLRETGSIQLVRASVLRDHRQVVTARHQLFLLPAAESLDVDTYEDLHLARRRLQQANIVFRVRANRHVGSGHLFHCLQIAEELDDHRVSFLLVDSDPFAHELLELRGFRWHTELDMARALNDLVARGVNLVINDVLDTSEAEILTQRAAGFLVVNIEDIGPGAQFAHWVVNALYSPATQRANTVHGATYAPLREEFHNPPRRDTRRHADRVLLTFGGTDPNDLASRCAKLLSANPAIELRVVAGPGARCPSLPAGVLLVDNPPSMAMEIMWADVVLTSAGRTVYEASILGTPVVVLAQNAREATHAHLGYETGVIFLGIGPLIQDHQIVGTVERLLADYDLRSELSARLRLRVDARGALRIASGIRNIISEHQ